MKRDIKKNNSAIHRLSSKIDQKEALLRDYSLDKASIDLRDPQYPQEPSEPIYQKPGLFNKINNSEYLCIVITNQPVIARGEVSYEELEEIADYIYGYPFVSFISLNTVVDSVPDVVED